ncbi:MAG TPA: hypothetical protein VN026_11060 [Bacteroidia bacterium]|jgi:hypothetical protein|nr:hypothetical protein [Bacteroidia bacterium]
MKFIFIFFLFLFVKISFSQKVLDLTYYNIFGKEKTFQFFNHLKFSYKLKGDLFCKTKTIANMQDSSLIFTDGTIIKIKQIKGVRIGGTHLSGYAFGAGLLFPALDITNNLMFNRTPIIKERALMVGGVFIAVGLVLKYVQDKHIRIRKNSTFRVFDPDYENLNVQK